MRFAIVLIATLFLLQSCLPEGKNRSLTYQNIIIISDLSDRIEPTINGSILNMQYPSKDISEIFKILNFFKNDCVKPGEKIGDKSCISFSTFTSDSIACIDIDKIEDLGAKQQFINSTGKFQQNGLEFEINNFKQKVQRAYDSVRNNGLDLISITIDKIESKPIIKKNAVLTNAIDTTFVNYDNHIYIFTDGYLEYKGKSLNKQYYFGNPEIEKIRKYCKANNVEIENALNSNISLCLPPVINDKNQLINLHILETHERDKDTKLQTYKNPKGLRDNEILEAVWRKWAKESGFKSFEWKKY